MANKGSRAYRWYCKYNIDELDALRAKIEAENPVVPGVHYDGIWLYSKNVIKKFDDIAQAITWHMADQKEKETGQRHDVDQYIGIGKRQN